MNFPAKFVGILILKDLLSDALELINYKCKFHKIN